MNLYFKGRLILYVAVACMFLLLMTTGLGRQDHLLTLTSIFLSAAFTGIIMWLEMNFGGHG